MERAVLAAVLHPVLLAAVLVRRAARVLLLRAVAVRPLLLVQEALQVLLLARLRPAVLLAVRLVLLVAVEEDSHCQ